MIEPDKEIKHGIEQNAGQEDQERAS